MSRMIVDAAEAIIDKEFQVLDKGFVRLVDYMGGDARVVQSARVSYGNGTTSFRRDRGLIRYLLRHKHTSPFEQVQLTFHAKMPIFVARQWVRHRTARINEVSGRYSVMRNDFYVPNFKNVCYQSNDNKQGRGEPLPEAVANEIINDFVKGQESDKDLYERLVNHGVARELARINLPLSLYTEWYWQIDLHNLFHFLKLRLDSHAQYEIRVYAEVMAIIAQNVAPISWEAFEDYDLKAVTFSANELRIIKESLGAIGENAVNEFDSAEEYNEFLQKLK